MLEIYNEQVRDLLVKNNPKGGLQVSWDLTSLIISTLELAIFISVEILGPVVQSWIKIIQG